MIQWGKRRGGNGASAQCTGGKGEVVPGGSGGREGWRRCSTARKEATGIRGPRWAKSRSGLGALTGRSEI
jgi:hypothetical protein